MFVPGAVFADGLLGLSPAPDDFMFIGELAKALGISARAIRYYEKEGLLKPARHGRLRMYRRSDEMRLRVIAELRAMGFSILEIKDSLPLFLDLSQADTRRAALAAIRAHRAELEKRRARLDAELALTDALMSKLTRWNAEAASPPCEQALESV